MTLNHNYDYFNEAVTGIAGNASGLVLVPIYENKTINKTKYTMKNTTLNLAETEALKQALVMRSVLADLQRQYEKLKELTEHVLQSFPESKTSFRQGEKQGLRTAIEALENALTKHFS